MLLLLLLPVLLSPASEYFWRTFGLCFHESGWWA
jgi:hypothetical protein